MHNFSFNFRLYLKLKYEVVQNPFFIGRNPQMVWNLWQYSCSRAIAKLMSTLLTTKRFNLYNNWFFLFMPLSNSKLNPTNLFPLATNIEWEKYASKVLPPSTMYGSYVNVAVHESLLFSTQPSQVVINKIMCCGQIKYKIFNCALTLLNASMMNSNTRRILL